MLLAWLAIFAHGIIPHNHSDFPNADCPGLFHSPGIDHCDSQSSDSFGDLHEERTVCHYSGNVIHELNSDNLIMLSDRIEFIGPYAFMAILTLDKSLHFKPDHHPGISALRAPPLS